MAIALNYLGHFASINELGTYFLIFLGASIWGDLTAIAGSLLAYRGYLDWTPLITLTFAGVFFGDNLVYQLGKYLRNKKFGLWILNHLPYRDTVCGFLTQNSLEALTLSKFIMGFNLPVLFMSGYLNVDLKIFVKSAFVSAIIWSAGIFTIGYMLGAAVYNIEQFGWKRIELTIALGVIVIIGFRMLTHKLGERVVRKESNLLTPREEAGTN